ncbi:MAG TPA: hydantoinase B/oxoprolinase family protein [Acidimicrobiia bacterium]|nr:hydantoinase B/oxoprolinase family protein [Acidimicrobiia bacterium]
MNEVDPIVIEIVEGTLASVEAEVEDAIGRTARSPMIRDQHDFRAGIHDAHMRKLTGRSYSALVDPIVRDFPINSMEPGDIYFHNDVYLSEGGIGHLPDLCVTVPVFAAGKVVAFVQAFGHHDDIGGKVPGSMPSDALSVFEEGLMVPPIKLYDKGVANQAALKIMTRNSRLPESLAGDLDAECSACRMGADRLSELFERYGTELVTSCFDVIIDRTTETFRREILTKIPEGTWTWEDYAEHDGVDPPKLHCQRITLTKTPEKLILDLNGTSPQAKGPINHAGGYADGVFLKKWLAPILRNLADTPERMAELDVNEGVVPLFEIKFPPPGTLVTPVFPAPTNARTFVILRLLGVFAGVLAKATGGRMPADQETIRYTGIEGVNPDGEWFFTREILGGGSGGRYYADGSDAIHVVPDSKNLPAEFVEGRFPVRIETLGLATDSGGAGKYRGGLGYQKEIRVFASDAKFMSIADRSILSCWGLNGGLAGSPFKVTINPGCEDERVMDGLCDREPVEQGSLIRVETTGGGGWGDPLERDISLVRLDVIQGKVSETAAEELYGVKFVSDQNDFEVDAIQTQTKRDELAESRGTLKFFDRGPGFELLAGTSQAEVDVV